MVSSRLLSGTSSACIRSLSRNCTYCSSYLHVAWIGEFCLKKLVAYKICAWCIQSCVRIIWKLPSMSRTVVQADSTISERNSPKRKHVSCMKWPRSEHFISSFPDAIINCPWWPFQICCSLARNGKIPNI